MACLNFSYSEGWIPVGNPSDAFYGDLTPIPMSSVQLATIIENYQIKNLNYNVGDDFVKSVLLDLCSNIRTEIHLFILMVDHKHSSDISECMGALPYPEVLSINII